MSGPGEVPAVECQDVWLRFGTTVAVAGLDLVVPRGRITALLGPSGCGKTTTLRLIAGFERPDEGRILLDGVLVADRHWSLPPEKRRVGMVFQDYALFPHLTVAQNVAYGLRHLPREGRRRRVAEVLELVGLSELADRYPAELSGGQQQRVALARALAPRPAVVLLDEPFSDLDAALRTSVRTEVRRILAESGTTALFVTHDQEEALSTADVVAVMADGRIRQVADPLTLYAQPADLFVATFVGDADLLPGTPAGRYFVHTPVGRLPTQAPVAGTDRLVVVLRPEQVRLTPAPDGAATVTEVSFFGHDQLVRVRLDGGTELRARLGPDLRLTPGDRVEVRIVGAVSAFPAEAATPDGAAVGGVAG